MATDEDGALPCEIALNGLAGGGSDRNDTSLVALPRHADGTVFEKKILETGSGQLGNTETARIHELEDGPVAAREWLGVVDRLEEPLHGRLIEGLGEVFLKTR